MVVPADKAYCILPILHHHNPPGATKRRAGIDVISSSDPLRARRIITLIYGQLGGPGWSWQCVCLYSKILGDYESVVHSIYYET